MSSSERRLHPAVMLLGVLQRIRGLFGITSLPWLFVAFRNGFEERTLILLVIVPLLIIVVGSVWGVLAWRATTYSVEGNAFRFRSGVLGRNERTIPLEHIQSVDTVQGLPQRLLNVVEVRIETAGGGGKEADVSLSAVSRPVALELQRELAPCRPVVSVAAAGVETDAPRAPEAVLIRRLGFGRLLLAGATSGQIGVVLPIIATASQLFDDVLTPEFVMRYAREYLPSSVAAGVVIVGGVLLVAWAVAVAGTVLQYANFELSREGDTLRIRRGLLERREVTIPINRIQAVQTVENLLRQPLGLTLVRMESAGYGADVGVSTMLFPLLSRDEVRDFLSEAAPEFAVNPSLHPLPPRALRRYVVRSVLPLLLPALAVAGVLVWRGFPELAPLPLVPLAVATLYGWVRYRGVGWAVAGDHLVVRARNIARTTIIAPRKRLQERSYAQDPFQRRAGLATLGVKVGRGSTFEIRDMDARDAREALAQLGPRPATP